MLARGGTYEIAIQDPGKGPDEAPVLIEEFSDFECPACRANYRTISDLISQYPTQVKFVYKDFPLPIHNQAQEAARGVLCAAQQEKFIVFHDAVFEDQPNWSAHSGDVGDLLNVLVGQEGMNQDDFDACTSSRDVKKAISADLLEGQNRGVSSTPTFFINGKKLEGGKSLFEWIQLVNEELEKKGLTPENELTESASDEAADEENTDATEEDSTEEATE